MGGEIDYSVHLMREELEGREIIVFSLSGRYLKGGI